MSYPGQPTKQARTLTSRSQTSTKLDSTKQTAHSQASGASLDPKTPGVSNFEKNRATLQALPPHLLHLILAKLADLPTLSSLSQCSHALHFAYKTAPSGLVSRILNNQIHSSVLGTALAAHAAAKIKVICVETTRDFAVKWLRRTGEGGVMYLDGLGKRCYGPTNEIRRWKLGYAMSISRLHFYVRSFARAMAGRCLAARGDAKEELSEVEMQRMERALYRFEIYNHLFRKKQSNYLHAVGEQMESFFGCWSGWENEQLACVQEFLVGCIAPVFNDLANHDILWGAHGIEPTYDSSSEFIQAILARGLPSIHRITRAKTYSERHKALYSPHPPYFTKFLYSGLEACQIASKLPCVHARKAFLVDGDQGPEKAWRWAQAGLRSKSHEHGCWNELKELRSWGYVFWDEKRLKIWDALNRHFQPHGETAEDRLIAAERAATIQASAQRRSAIHVAGGSGWWNADDESKVIWIVGKPSPLDDDLKRRACDLCIGEVLCAAHRLQLVLPAMQRNMVDDGISLKLDLNHLQDIGLQSHGLPTSSHWLAPQSPCTDEFRLSRIPSHNLASLDLQLPFERGEFRYSQLPTPDFSKLGGDAAIEYFASRLSQMPLREGSVRARTVF